MKLSLRHAMIGFSALGAMALGALFAVPFRDGRTVGIRINDTVITAQVVDDDAGRVRGLGGRPSLGDSEGMLFAFSMADYHSIWMKGMKFPIDILWIRDGSVVDVEENALPPAKDAALSMFSIYRPRAPAQFVLETVAGFAKKNHIVIGDRVTIEGFSATTGVSAEASGQPARVTQNVASATALPGEPLQPGAEFFIENLRVQLQRGSEFKIEKMLSRTGAYTKFLISYLSGRLKISGVMNVPAGEPPVRGWPVLILNHGLIHPSVYFSGRGSKREQDFFTRRGYVTIHPDYRGHASSDPNPSTRHDFYVGYTEDVIAAVDAISAFKSSLVDKERIGMWGHSMGGGMAARVMALRPDIRAYVLFAPISADVEDNFYELKKSEVAWLHATYGPAGAAGYRMMSPLTYFKDVAGPVQLHHGTADKDVPIAFSEKMYEALTKYGKKTEFFTYQGESHEFGEAWIVAVERAAQFFDKYVKNTR